MRSRIIAAMMVTIAHLFMLATMVLGHPGSGIVVDRVGNVFFADTGHGVWKIDANGQLSHAYPSTGHHWLSLVPAGSFSRAELKKWVAESGIPNFDRVSPELIGADGQPFVMGGDG